MDLIIEISGTQVGSVESAWSFGKENTRWIIEGYPLTFEYSILKGYETTHKKIIHYSTDILNIPDPTNELIVLMLVIAMSVGGTSKADDLKDKLKYERRKFF